MPRATNTASLIPPQPVGGDEAVLAAAKAATDFENPRTQREPERPFVIGEASSKYLFRSVRGVLRDAKLHLDVYEDWWDDPQDDPKSHMSRQLAKVFAQGWKRRNTPERQAVIRQAIEDNDGSPDVVFIKAPPVGRSDGSGVEDNTKIEVYYQTNSDAIAELLRQAIADKRGDFQFIYEVDQSTHLKVGDKRFARTPVGLQMAHDYMQQSGETSMELEAKAS